MDENEARRQEYKLNIRRIWLFLAITFGLTYVVEFLVIIPMVGSSNAEEAMAAQSMIAGVMFFPAMATLLTRLLTGEKLSFGNLMLTLNLKGNLKYYGLAWFGFGFMIVLGAVLYFLLFGKQFDAEMGYAKMLFEAQAQVAGTELQMSVQEIRAAVWIQLAIGFVLAPFANLLNCFGEEWGWRGYLLPKMLKTCKVVPAVLASGVIWGLWHLPLIMVGYNYGIGYAGFPVVGILLMCLFCVAVGTVLSYVTIRVESCIPAIMGHGMINGFAMSALYFTSLDYPYNVLLGPMPTGLIGMIPFLGLAVYLLIRLDREEKRKMADGSRVLLKREDEKS